LVLWGPVKDPLGVQALGLSQVCATQCQERAVQGGGGVGSEGWVGGWRGGGVYAIPQCLGAGVMDLVLWGPVKDPLGALGLSQVRGWCVLLVDKYNQQE
jgi:hypothetical protein